MQRSGISTACYYPLLTEESFIKLCKNDIRCIEIFFNSPSELSDNFIDNIVLMKKHYGVSVPSVHPYMSFAETFFLFSSYERRFHDILDLYRRFFEAMCKLESKIFIIHGIKKPGSIDDETYFDRFAELIRIGKQYDVTVCQENVVLHRSENCEFLNRMKNYIGDDLGIVLDIKQARRANENIDNFINTLGTSIKHIHISDADNNSTCLPPTYGNFDFADFFKKISYKGYDGKFIIELYEDSYSDESEIFDSYKKISKILVDYFE